ncbi:hypothetical protein DMC30DRAFT_420397 [Rhodotorula diobovata]|uniref:Uncharacterized protein n=1 Tax=Rhodotorula diobovata TaxID=5288 RepID=A0A5C5FJK3_9BASI|nr:hypothetical protein DMC30DRAFT_420397 [Rhodotorula diobovata]
MSSSSPSASHSSPLIALSSLATLDARMRMRVLLVDVNKISPSRALPLEF